MTKYYSLLLLSGLAANSLSFTPKLNAQKKLGHPPTSLHLSPKEEILGLLRKDKVDPILSIDSENVVIEAKNILIGDEKGQDIKYRIRAGDKLYSGSSSSYLDLLEPTTTENESETRQADKTSNASPAASILRAITPFLPPPVRSILPGLDGEYIPMRDLFTSPTVSFAYERGWRQGFSQAGFPGPDKEAQMAMEYFERPMAKSSDKVLVDMSCATGLFTRRFAKSNKYLRVLGCDYSKSMLDEARRRINQDRDLDSVRNKIDLVRLDVGKIPFKNSTIDALHAGAAMHCWPDLPAAVSEIHRVLKPGGRYFATTFLSSYFRTLQATAPSGSSPSQQAFQYFASVDELRSMMEAGGFSRDKINIEILGNACVVIRCEKDI